MSRTLSSRADFVRLAQCCRRFSLNRSGRVSVDVSFMESGQRNALEERINRLWQACGCAEASVATLGLLVLWFLGLHPFEAWRQQAPGLLAGLACLGFVTVGVAAIKVASIALAHRRLARLLDRQGDALFG